MSETCGALPFNKDYTDRLWHEQGVACQRPPHDPFDGIHEWVGVGQSGNRVRRQFTSPTDWAGQHNTQKQGPVDV